MNLFTRHLHKAPPFAVALLLLASACSKRPENVLSDSEMEKFLTDMMLADAYEQSAAGRGMPDSIRRNLGESVMKAHGIDYETLDSTYAWYSRNLDDYYKLYSRVEKRLDKRRRNIEGMAALPDNEMQNDIWQLPQHITFSTLGEGDALVFELPGEAISKGERLEWKLHLSNGLETSMLLGLDYEDGSTCVATRDFHQDRNLKMKLISDTAKDVRRIFGVLSVPRSGMPVYSDSITLIKLPFDSVEYRNTWAQKNFYGPRSRPVVTLEKDSVSNGSDSLKVKE